MKLKILQAVATMHPPFCCIWYMSLNLLQFHNELVNIQEVTVKCWHVTGQLREALVSRIKMLSGVNHLFNIRR